MTQSASDLLEVLVLAKEAGIYRLHSDGRVESGLNVAPLLETIDDLVAGPKIMRTLFEMDIYRTHLHERKKSSRDYARLLGWQQRWWHTDCQLETV